MQQHHDHRHDAYGDYRHGDYRRSSVPSISVSDLSNTFSAMASLKSLAAAGKGSIAVLLPDTVSSTRYVEFDAPYLKHAFTTAGRYRGQVRAGVPAVRGQVRHRLHGRGYLGLTRRRVHGTPPRPIR